MNEEFSIADLDTLKQCEITLEQGAKHFMAVGQALATIREKRLYKIEGFTSFEVYCNEKWQITRQHASRLIQAFQMSPSGDSPFENESQARKARQAKKNPQRKQPSDQLKLRGLLVKVSTLLETTETDPVLLYDILSPLREWCIFHEKWVARKTEDGQFDKAA